MIINQLLSKRQVAILLKWQLMGAELAMHKYKYCFFWDMGVGKTLLCIAIAKAKAVYSGDTTLIVTKDDLIRDNIVPAIKMFCPEMNYTVLSGPRKNIVKINKILRSKHVPQEYKPKIYITSVDVFRDLWSVICDGIDVLITDESGLLRNASSGLSTAFRDAADKFNFKCIYPMSGLPAPNCELEYFTQLYLVSKETFGKTFTEYRDKFFKIAKKSDARAGKYILKDRQLFNSELKNYSEYIDRNDVFSNIKEPIRSKKYFDLTDEQRVYYNIVLNKTKKYILTHSGKSIETLLPFLVKQVKWAEIITGIYKPDEENAKSIEMKSGLYDALMAVLDDANEPTVIWCNFDYEQSMVIKTLLKHKKKLSFVHSSQKKEEQKRARDAFKAGEVQYLVVKPSANAHGHNFQNVCRFSVETSMTFSYDNRKQGEDRIFRPPYKKVCMFTSLIARDTISEVMYDASEQKKDVLMAVLEYLKLNI